MQFSHLGNLLGTNAGALGNPNFMESKYSIGMLENPRPIDFMESKLEGIIGSSSRNFDFFGNGDMGMAVGLGGDMNNGHQNGGLPHNFHGLNCSPVAAYGGMSLDGNNNVNGANYIMDSCQRLMLPYDASEDHNASIDVKPNPKLLALEWQDQGCSDAGKESSFGYLNGPGSWSGMMNGYGSSTTNPLV